MNQIKITLKKSLIGCTKKQKVAAKCLKLRKPGQSNILALTPVHQGQIKKILHLISIEEVNKK